MTLPADLLQAISAQGGGKIALVLGAGCSVEAPTNIPVAKELAMEVYRRLLADGVLQVGECLDPNDLSVVTDSVFAAWWICFVGPKTDANYSYPRTTRASAICYPESFGPAMRRNGQS